MTKDKVDLIVEQYPDVWKTRAAFMSFLKGIIRKGWSRHPVKLILLKKHRKQIPNPNPRGNKPTVWGADCSICKGTFVMSEIETDHHSDEVASLTKIEDIQSCVEKLLVIVEDDLRIVCKGCHSIVSLSQRLGCSFEEAKVRKEVIAFGKLSAESQIDRLKELSLPIDKTKKGRQDTFEQWLKGREVQPKEKFQE